MSKKRDMIEEFTDELRSEKRAAEVMAAIHLYPLVKAGIVWAFESLVGGFFLGVGIGLGWWLVEVFK